MVTAEQIQQAIEATESALVRDVIIGLAKDVDQLNLANRELSEEIVGISGEMERLLGPPNLLTGICERLPEQWIPSVAEALVHPLDERAESRKTGW